jgi:multimeric flavodoxin WrbA
MVRLFGEVLVSEEQLNLKFSTDPNPNPKEAEMRIIGLAGSPRKGGNSDLLLDALLAGAQSQGAEAIKYALNRLSIRGCQACYACKKTGKCKQRDDMDQLYPELLAADVWVFATPVYWWGPSAQLKLALDRMFPFCHPPLLGRVQGKQAVLLTASEDKPAAAAPHLRGMMREAMNYLGVEWAGELLVQAYQKGEVKNNRAALAKARKLGEKLALGSGL